MDFVSIANQIHSFIFNYKYAGIVKTCKMWVFLRHFFILLFVYHFFWDRPQFGLVKLFTLGYCWTVPTAETSNVIIEIWTSWFLLKKFVVTSNLLFFYDLLIILLGAKRTTIINVVGLHILKKRSFVAVSIRNLIDFTKFGVRTVSSLVSSWVGTIVGLTFRILTCCFLLAVVSRTWDLVCINLSFASRDFVCARSTATSQ